MKTTVRVAAALSAVALLVAACGEDPDDDGGETTSPDAGSTATDESTDAAAADFLGCMVTDEGGVNDKSFNETSWNGLEAAKSAGSISETNVAESKSDADYGPNVQNMVDADCGLIVTVGFLLAGATADAASANPEEKFTIVDFLYVDDSGKPTPIENVKSLVFNTQEAAFLAGYAAASHSETGKVGTWGGAKIPTVTIFMDGFYDGVMYYNDQKDADVEVLGWDKAGQEGQFVGNFSDTGKALQISKNMIDQDVDVIHPVAGPLAASAAQAARAADGVTVVWADSDGYESSEFGDVILTSVLKNMDVAVQKAVDDTAAGSFSNESFVGTLENDGVGLAEFHDFDSEVSDETKQELDDIKQQIIDGDIIVESDAAFSTDG